MKSSKQEQEEMTRAFGERCQALGIDVDDRLFWYHTIDLGQGLITPGSFDYRESIQFYQFPDDLRGRRVLDVGSGTGFFAFDFERRGAQVTSVEIPSLFQWDRFPGEPPLRIAEKIRALLSFHSIKTQPEIDLFFSTHSPSEIYYFLLDGPFRFCHRILDSHVKRVYSSVYALPDALASDARFDYILASDVLLHLIDPLSALAALERLCDGTIAIAQTLAPDGPPCLQYVGGGCPGDDAAEWWRPNFAWFEQVLRKLGFGRITRGASFAGTSRPGGRSFEKTVVHAHR
jgi:tRNA (mo5U34)-methyltransferase